MNDMISRQMAIDMLKNRWKKTRNYEGIGDDIAEECELYLKQVPSAQPEQQWIPCSERLPEDEQPILFSTTTGRVHQGRFHMDNSINRWYSSLDKMRAYVCVDDEKGEQHDDTIT